MTDPTPLLLEADEIDRAATPGEWFEHPDVPRSIVSATSPNMNLLVKYAPPDDIEYAVVGTAADARFIARSRTLLPALASVCREQAAVIERLRAEVGRLTRETDGNGDPVEYECIANDDGTEYALVGASIPADSVARGGCTRLLRRFTARSWQEAKGWHEALMAMDRERIAEVARAREKERAAVVALIRRRQETARARPVNDWSNNPGVSDGYVSACDELADDIERGAHLEKP